LKNAIGGVLFLFSIFPRVAALLETAMLALFAFLVWGPDTLRRLRHSGDVLGHFAGALGSFRNIAGHFGGRCRLFLDGGVPRILVLDEMNREEGDLRKRRIDEAESAASVAKSTIVFGTLLCLLVVNAAGFLITRSLSGQIGAAVRRVQSSSAELQSAANNKRRVQKSHRRP
jgi:hypothetical protein